MIQLASRGTVLFLAALLATSAAAETIPGFKLAPCTGSARVIAGGQLDKAGRLRVTQVYCGDLDAGKPLLLKEGAERYAELNKVSKQDGPLEVIAFLAEKDDRGWEPVRGRAGLVRFVREDLFTYGYDEVFNFRNPRLDKHLRYTRASFLDALRRAVRVEKERRRLLGLPASPRRVRELMRLLRKLEPDDRHYHRWLVCGGLRPIALAEERTLVSVLKTTTDTEERVLILDVMRDLPLSGASFDAVAAWTDRKHPGPVRRSAMEALDRIDSYRAAERLARLLSLNEPEVSTLLTCLWPTIDVFPRNARAVDALALFAGAVRHAQAAEGPGSTLTGTDTLVRLLAGHGHPRLIPVLYEWALADNHPSCAQALSELQSLTGLKFSRAQRNEWLAWWRKAGPALEATGKLRGHLTGHTGAIRSVQFTPDGKSPITAAEDRSVKFWDPVTGQERLTLAATREILGLALAPDNRTLAVHWGAEQDDRYAPEEVKLYRAAAPNR